MPKFSTARKIKVAARALKNQFLGRPITVSFEVTYNCNARCKHCHLGSYVKENKASASVYGQRLVEIRPVVAQISGGEPLIRKDLFEIVAEMRRRDPVAVIVLTTNVQLLDEEKYLKLRAAGVDQFSLSLDYPDERHDEFRHLKGCFQHMSALVPRLAAHGNDDLVLACVVQSDNFHDLPQIAELAKRWGACVNFSIYTHLRTNDLSYYIGQDGQLAELRDVVENLIAMQNDGYPIATSDYSLRKMIDFYADRSLPDCEAGRKFFIVTPAGNYAPCGLIPGDYATQREMVDQFTRDNKCTLCYTAIRANSEKKPGRMLLDALRVVRVRK
jgi:MoaA/NifB/PqqE/SkfB family radical SAM enzyme